MKTKKNPFKKIEVQQLKEETVYILPDLADAREAINQNAKALKNLDHNTKLALKAIMDVLENHYETMEHANAHIARIDEKLRLEDCAVDADEHDPEEVAQRVKVVKLNMDIEPEVLMDVIDELINGKLIKLTSLGEKVVETIKENLED